MHIWLLIASKAIDLFGQRLIARAAKSCTWCDEHPVGAIFVLCYAIAIASDLFLVLVLGADSISLRTWIATSLHPTLIAAGMLWGMGTCWLVRDQWGLVMFQGIMTGHLFVHY